MNCSADKLGCCLARRSNGFALAGEFGVVVVLCALTLLAGGCGRRVAQVSGMVTHQGQPVAGAEVTLEPADAVGAASGGETSPGAPSGARRYTGVTTHAGALYVSFGADGGSPPGACVLRVKHFTRLDGQPLPPGEEGQALRDTNRVASKTYVFEPRLAAGANVLDLKLEEALRVE